MRGARDEEALVGGFFVPAGRAPARRGAHARRRPPPRRIRRPLGRGPRLRARPRRRRRDRPARRARGRPRGDLLQAGPLLVRDGAPSFSRADDAEGFSAGESQFDSDITDGRYPRAALGLADGQLLAVACDGRSRHDAGMTLEELSELLVALGCTSAMNLDGGGSTSLVSGGRLHNRPRGAWERPEVGWAAVSTALLFLRADLM